MSRPSSEQIDALCCACGNVRKVARYAIPLTHNRVLTCRPCGARTMHAYVLPSGVCDWREAENTTKTTNVQIDPLDAVRSQGWTVFEIEGMRALATFSKAVSVVIIRSGASPDELARVADRILSMHEDGA